MGVGSAEARSSSQAESLIAQCAQVEDALEYMDGLSKLVFDADPDEMLAAGYCIGVLSEYRRKQYNGCYYTVREGAKKIGAMKGYGYSVGQMLKATCR